MRDDGRELRAGFVLPVRAGRGHPPTLNEARGPNWRRSSRGFYVPSWVPEDDVEQRIVEASVVIPEDGGAIIGWGQLRWQGGRWFDGLTAIGEKRPVAICMGTRDIRPQPGIQPSGEGPYTHLRRWVDGLPVMDSRLSVSFEMRYARSARQAVIELEKALYDDLVSIAEMEEFFKTQRGSTGIPQARDDALPMAQENSWSPAESDQRMVWELEARMPRPLCNRPVFDLGGRFVATPDLIDHRAGVYGQYDGDVHLDRGVRDRDIRTDAALRRLGLEGATMTAADRRDHAAFIARLRDAYARAERRPVADRLWTVEPPPWWVLTDTVDRRRALTQDQARRFLKYRRPA